MHAGRQEIPQPIGDYCPMPGFARYSKECKERDLMRVHECECNAKADIIGRTEVVTTGRCEC